VGDVRGPIVLGVQPEVSPFLSKIPVVSVVDDDDSVRASIGALVRSLGYTAYAYASAEELLDSGEAAASDCLVADIQMPGMSGIELQRTLARQGHQVPIIFITAFPEDRIRSQVLAAGAVGLLSKPCDGDVLVNCIEAALSSRD
jgi:FixJ family two-component response regulator